MLEKCQKIGIRSSLRDNSNEYHKRANFPENIEFSGISLYLDTSIRHHKNTQNFVNGFMLSLITFLLIFVFCRGML